jgi:hypothetical protein
MSLVLSHENDLGGGFVFCDDAYRRTADTLIVLALAYNAYSQRANIQAAAAALAFANEKLKFLGLDFQSIWKYVCHVLLGLMEPKNIVLNPHYLKDILLVGTFSFYAWRNIASTIENFKWIEWIVCSFLTQLGKGKAALNEAVEVGAGGLKSLWETFAGLTPRKIPRNAESAILYTTILPGMTMVDFHGHAARGNFFTKEEFEMFAKDDSGYRLDPLTMAPIRQVSYYSADPTGEALQGGRRKRW